MKVFSKTTERFIAQAKQLRSEADEAEERFLDFLFQGEQQRAIWMEVDGTFAGFLRITNLCDPVRYARYKRVREGIGKDATEVAGGAAIVAAGALTNPVLQREVIDRAKAFAATE